MFAEINVDVVCHLCAISPLVKVIPIQPASITIGFLNFDGTSLSRLGSIAVMWWRLWDIIIFTIEREPFIVIIRFWPHVTRRCSFAKPFPYMFLDRRTSCFVFVGVLVNVDHVETFMVLDYVCFCKNILVETGNVQPPICLLTMLYAPIDDEVNVWFGLLKKNAHLKRMYKFGFIVVHGNLNVHLYYVAKNVVERFCAHCKKNTFDRPYTLYCANMVLIF